MKLFINGQIKALEVVKNLKLIPCGYTFLEAVLCGRISKVEPSFDSVEEEGVLREMEGSYYRGVPCIL